MDRKTLLDKSRAAAYELNQALLNEAGELTRLQGVRGRIVYGRPIRRLVMGSIRLPWINFRIRRSIRKIGALVSSLESLMFVALEE